MADYKRSVTFSLSERQIGMMNEMIAKEKVKKSVWLQDLILKEYIASGTIKSIELHAVKASARIWGIDAFSSPAPLFMEGNGYCNPNLQCRTCSPIWEKAREARSRMEGQ
tara:strand:+ start:3133 stop:3462 length:330 start_codon:yes stop_codon:yes gene_type:complete